MLVASGGPTASQTLQLLLKGVCVGGRGWGGLHVYSRASLPSVLLHSSQPGLVLLGKDFGAESRSARVRLQLQVSLLLPEGSAWSLRPSSAFTLVRAEMPRLSRHPKLKVTAGKVSEWGRGPTLDQLSTGPHRETHDHPHSAISQMR